MIRVRPFPASDAAFAARIRDAIGRAGGSPPPENELIAESEAVLRRALSHVRAAYPDVWIRRQDVIASPDGVEAWYTFRDQAVAESANRRQRG